MAGVDGNDMDENNNNNNNNNNNDNGSEQGGQQQRDLRRGGRGRGRGGLQGPDMSEMVGMVIDEQGVLVRSRLFNFLNSFESELGTLYYVDQLNSMQEEDSTTLIVDWLHLRPENTSLSVGREIEELADAIQNDFYHFEPYLRQSIANFVREHKPNYVQNNDNTGEDKQFNISIQNFMDISALRKLDTKKIGQLCSFSATVTRTTEVRPELIYGSFQCPECGLTVKNVTQQFKYTEPKRCLNQDCQNSKDWRLLVDRSKFVDWQKCRVQENSHDIPPGSMPRSMDVILRNEIVENCKPGDNTTFSGTLIVVPDVSQFYTKTPTMVRGQQRGGASGGGGGGAGGVTGLRSLGVRELSYKLVFLANNVRLTHEIIGGGSSLSEGDIDFDDIDKELTKSEQEALIAMKDSPKLYEKLANSIAPNIYGHHEMKRGILLMLFGGVKKETRDKVKLRGDINICIVGDPSTAKSQFLKFVSKVLPRTIYTSGKASTAAGLTAAVMRDSETGEFGIEAGALMLADNGICCIDEFDKMDALDVAAIHEAMEQQTITITKAGIQATLNARASILAAANPLWGRYDKSKPLRYNVNISPPIMSRFDLFFVILDECDETTDFHVASHIVKLHKTGEVISSNGGNEFTIEQIQRYIRYARTIKPEITSESHQLLVRYYRQLRQRDQSEQKAYRITVRQLESLIRLSEALARVHFDHQITPKYVKEAARLLSKSIISVEEPDIQLLESLGISEDLDEEEEEQQPTEQEGGGEGGGGSDETADKQVRSEEEEDSTESRQARSVSYNEYIQTANLIVYYIRHNEDEDGSGLKQNDLENIFMKEKAELCENENEFAMEHKKLTYIIERLISIDHILLIKTPHDTPTERVLMVHPNYDPDSRNTRNLQQSTQSQSQSVSVGAGAGGAGTTENENEEENENENENNNNNNNNEASVRRSRRIQGKNAGNENETTVENDEESEDQEMAERVET